MSRKAPKIWITFHHNTTGFFTNSSENGAGYAGAAKPEVTERTPKCRIVSAADLAHRPILKPGLATRKRSPRSADSTESASPLATDLRLLTSTVVAMREPALFQCG